MPDISFTPSSTFIVLYIAYINCIMSQCDVPYGIRCDTYLHNPVVYVFLSCLPFGEILRHLFVLVRASVCICVNLNFSSLHSN